MSEVDVNQARALAEEAAATHWNRAIEIQDELTREFSGGWMFFYNSREFVHSGKKGAALFGNAPIIVNRRGRVTWTGSLHDADEYIEAYEALGPDQFEAGGWQEYLAKKAGR